MPSYILDTSAFIKLVLPEVGSDRVHQLLVGAADGVHEVYLLDFALVEGSNVLWKRQQRGEMEPDQALEALARLRALGESAQIRTSAPYLRRARESSMALSLPGYDAAGLACAESGGLVLVTEDRRQAQLAGQLVPPVTVALLATRED